MRKRLVFLGLYGGFWIIYFLLAKGAFLTYQWEESKLLSFDLIGEIFRHGSKMDLSFAAYLCLIPFLLVSFTALMNSDLPKRIIGTYTLISLFIITFLIALDMELFQFWGFRLDTSAFGYIETPSIMLASASSSPLAFLVLGIVVISLAFYQLYLKKIASTADNWPSLPIYSFIPFLLLTLALILPIRGGTQLAPLNHSTVYFSQNNFANQAALNAPWNFFRSLIKNDHNDDNPYIFMDQKTAKTKADSLYRVTPTVGKQITGIDRPNVLIILWESFTAKAVGALGGRFARSTPQFDSLIREGVLFTNFYASGDRSDKGIISVLSGYPAQPMESIIKLPKKAAQLPALSKDFKNLGYSTSFYHGGELEFANIKSYLLNTGFDQIISKEYFKPEDMNSKWGAHDHVVLQKWLEDQKDPSTPFFSVVFTLSSHEPFEVPMKNQFSGTDLESLYLNSLYYTDHSIGNFIKEIKTKDWYENTLVIILADHGHRLLDQSQRYHPDKYHIPMLWLGGALKDKNTQETAFCSQTDMAATLLSQLKQSHSQYAWSRNILNPQTSTFAPYVFNHGLGYISGNGYFAYDQVSGTFLHRDPAISQREVIAAQAHLQVLYQDFLDK